MFRANCSDADYIEAVSLTPIDVESVEEIRWESDDELQNRAVIAMLDGSSVSEDLDLDLHAQSRERAKARRIRWTGVKN